MQSESSEYFIFVKNPVNRKLLNDKMTLEMHKNEWFLII